MDENLPTFKIYIGKLIEIKGAKLIAPLKDLFSVIYQELIYHLVHEHHQPFFE